MTTEIKKSIFKLELYIENDELKITNDLCIDSLYEADKKSMEYIGTTLWRLSQLIDKCKGDAS